MVDWLPLGQIPGTTILGVPYGGDWLAASTMPGTTILGINVDGEWFRVDTIPGSTTLGVPIAGPAPPEVVALVAPLPPVYGDAYRDQYVTDPQLRAEQGLDVAGGAEGPGPGGWALGVVAALAAAAFGGLFG